MKMIFGAICCCIAAFACSTAQADLVLGDSVGIDFSDSQGGTVTNWNTVDEFSGILAANSVTGTDGVLDPNLTFTWSVVDPQEGGINNNGAEDNTELSGQPSYPDDVLGDWIGFRDNDLAGALTGNPGSITLTFAGLDPNLIYEITVGAANDAANENADTTWSVNGGTSQTTDADVAANAYVTFTGITGSGPITVTGLAGGTAGIAPEIGLVSAVQIKAVAEVSQVPEPSSLALLGLGVVGLATRRRR